MTDEQLIEQIKAALDALKAGDDTAKQELARLFAGLDIELRDITSSTGTAIGNNINQVIIQNGYTPEQVIEIVRATRTEGSAPAPKGPESSGHVFISYARVDGAGYAEDLYTELTKQGYAAWRDTRNLDPYKDMSGEIEQAIEQAAYVVVVVTPDVRREDSFVRREIAFALEEQKPIIPLIFPDGRRPITIINHTYISFTNWEQGFTELLDRLKTGVAPVPPVTRRERELAYLERIGQEYEHWRDLYTDMAATARIEQPKVKLKAAAARYLQMQHDIFEDIDHTLDDSKGKIITVESFDELREGVHHHRRVALIGDPGAGKTTTLERLAYELATSAADDSEREIPLFVRLGAYPGGDFETFLQQHFSGLDIAEYLASGQVFLLLDGLNEMPSDYIPNITTWLNNHPDAQAIVSCRKLDYVGFELPLQRIDVVPLDISRIDLFLSNYLEDEDRERLFWGLAGRKNTEVWQWLKKQKGEVGFKDFWFSEPGEEPLAWELEDHRLWSLRTALREHLPGDLPRELFGMLGVVSNPFLLFVAIQVFTRQGQPPDNRGQLFDQFVTLLFRQRGKPASKTRPPWIEDDLQRKALASLAYRMQAEDIGTSATTNWVIEVFREALPKHDPQQVLYLTASASIVEYNTQTVRFTHQLLQEYFAAFQMKEDVESGVSAKKYWPDDERWWAQTGWEETAVLLAGLLNDATPVVEWLTPVQPRLAYRCATESGADCAEDALQTLYEAEPPQRVATLAKVRWGNILAKRGDTRPGVGLDADDLPDIEWLPVLGVKDWTMQTDDGKLGPFTIEPFQMAKYPVTYAQYQSFVEAADGYANADWWSYSEEATQWRSSNPQPRAANWPVSNRPREQVTWYEAVAFCRWLSAKTGSQIRLPTEWEWQWAAAGDTDWDYPWGPDYLPGFANIDEVGSGVGPYYLRETTAVGIYPQGASPFGVLDMSGNVWEWCLNEYREPENTALGGDARRVVRGGAFGFGQDFARVSVRYISYPGYRLNIQGFRLVLLPSI